MKKLLLAAGIAASAVCAPSTTFAHDSADMTDVPATIVEALSDLAQRNRLLMLGEMHGSREVPSLVLATTKRLLDENQAVVVALEMPERMQSSLTEVMVAEHDEKPRADMLADEFWTWRDGRSSKAMLALIEGLRDLRQSGADVAILPFDANVTPDMSAEIREKTMATNLRQGFREHQDARFIVLAGNYHARLKKGAPWSADHEFMAYQLRDLKPNALNVTAPIGRVWVCNPECGYYSFGVGRPMGKPAIELFDALSDAGYSGEVVLPSFSASPPASP